MSSLKLKLSLTAAAVLLAGCSLPSDGPTEETIMQRQVEAHENVQIQLSNRVSALEQELQGVEGKIEELNHSIQQLVARQQDLYQTALLTALQTIPRPEDRRPAITRMQSR